MSLFWRWLGLGLCAWIALAGGRTACAAADDAPMQKADLCLTNSACKEMYRRARELSRTGQLDATTVLYREAYKLRPAAWLLLNLGRVLHRQGKLVEAIASYEGYLRAAQGEQAARLDKAREYLAQAQAELASQPKEPAPPPAAAPSEPVESSEPEPPPAPLIIEPPPAELLKLAPPIVPLAGRIESRPVDAPRESGVRRHLGAGFFIGIGMSGALLATSVVTGSLALSGASQLASAQYLGTPSDALLNQQARSRALAITTDVLLATSAVTLVVAVAVTFGRRRPSQPIARMQAARAENPSSAWK